MGPDDAIICGAQRLLARGIVFSWRPRLNESFHEILPDVVMKDA
jgi:hypothetical protein